MFEHTTFVAISENLLQGFLVVFHHSFLVLARLGMESRHLISGGLELQKERRSLNRQVGNLSFQPSLIFLYSHHGISYPSQVILCPCLGLARCYGRQTSHFSLMFGLVPFFLHPFNLLHTSFGFLLPMF